MHKRKGTTRLPLLIKITQNRNVLTLIMTDCFTLSNKMIAVNLSDYENNSNPNSTIILLVIILYRAKLTH